MATINDVCKASGVSKATVSRVINGSGLVKEKTREAVLAAMESLGYHPNVLAQALATNSSNSIGIILPHFDSHYFGTILRKAAQEMKKANKQLFVMDSHDGIEGEIEAIQSLAKHRCDVIIIYSRHLSQDQLIDIQAKINTPLIVLNRSLDTERLFSFGFEQEQLARIAVEHLIELGHKHIACITNPLGGQTGERRLQSFRESLSKHGLVFNEKLVFDGSSMLNGGYDAIQRLLDSREKFTAILACNDDMAIGAIRALHEHGKSVPRDISVVGIDDEPISRYSIPSLTTVSLPIEKLTHDALQLASSLIAKSEFRPGHHDYIGKLVVRESSQPLK
jgi:LacI family transcriptional regulator